MKAIDSFTKEYKEHIITFMRIGDKVSWHVKLKGEIYGDFITLEKTKIASPDDLKDVLEMLYTQATVTLSKLTIKTI